MGRPCPHSLFIPNALGAQRGALLTIKLRRQSKDVKRSLRCNMTRMTTAWDQTVRR